MRLRSADSRIKSPRALSGRSVIYGLLVSALTLSRSLACTPDDNAACFDIPSQSLSDALDRFSEQSGLQVIYEHSLIADSYGTAVSGALSIDAALNRLLSQSDFAWEYVNARTVLIRRVSGAGESRAGSRARGQTDTLSVTGNPSSN